MISVLLRIVFLLQGTPEFIRRQGRVNMTHATVRQLVGAQHPLGRLGQPEDIVNLAIDLASDESGWVTDDIFPIDGERIAQ
jgi:NAD(P)-dependent dehydrogenase (short-subunit alcohol dehydrogenase family)